MVSDSVGWQDPGMSNVSLFLLLLVHKNHELSSKNLGKKRKSGSEDTGWNGAFYNFTESLLRFPAVIFILSEISLQSQQS